MKELKLEDSKNAEQEVEVHHMPSAAEGKLQELVPDTWACKTVLPAGEDRILKEMDKPSGIVAEDTELVHKLEQLDCKLKLVGCKMEQVAHSTPALQGLPV